MSALLRKMRRERLALDYTYKSKVNSKPALLALLRASTLTPDQSDLVECLDLCGSKRADGKGRVRCSLPFCPYCGSRMIDKEARDGVKSIIARLGRMPDESEASFVTINWEQVELGSDPRDSNNRFRTKLKNILRSSLFCCSIRGHFDLSMNENLHAHFVLLHPDMSKDQVESILKEAFPGPRRVHLSEWKSNRSMVENLKAVLSYASNHHPYVSREDVDSFSGDRVRDYLWSMWLLKGRGLSGIRINLNMKSDLKWKGSVLLDSDNTERGHFELVHEGFCSGRRQRNVNPERFVPNPNPPLTLFQGERPHKLVAASPTPIGQGQDDGQPYAIQRSRVICNRVNERMLTRSKPADVDSSPDASQKCYESASDSGKADQEKPGFIDFFEPQRPSPRGRQIFARLAQGTQQEPGALSNARTVARSSSPFEMAIVRQPQESVIEVRDDKDWAQLHEMVADIRSDPAI